MACSLPLQDSHAPQGELRSLPYRTLVRGWLLGLPSGQSVALRMGIDPLPGDHPLWIYLLEEAAAETGGRRLGAVGARLVCEVLVGLLASDPTAFVNVEPGWRPQFQPDRDRYELADFLRAAGMSTTADEWRAARAA